MMRRTRPGVDEVTVGDLLTVALVLTAQLGVLYRLELVWRRCRRLASAQRLSTELLVLDSELRQAWTSGDVSAGERTATRYAFAVCADRPALTDDGWWDLAWRIRGAANGLLDAWPRRPDAGQGGAPEEQRAGDGYGPEVPAWVLWEIELAAILRDLASVAQPQGHSIVRRWARWRPTHRR